MNLKIILSGLIIAALMAGLFAGSHLFPKVLTNTDTITTTFTESTSFIIGERSSPFIDSSEDFTLYKGSLNPTYKGMTYITSLGLGAVDLKQIRILHRNKILTIYVTVGDRIPSKMPENGDPIFGYNLLIRDMQDGSKYLSIDYIVDREGVSSCELAEFGRCQNLPINVKVKRKTLEFTINLDKTRLKDTKFIIIKVTSQYAAGSNSTDEILIEDYMPEKSQYLIYDISQPSTITITNIILKTSWVRTTRTITKSFVFTTLIHAEPSKGIVKVIKHDSYRDDLGWLHVNGIVQNQGNMTVKHVYVLIIIYDSTGHMIGGKYTIVKPSELLPGNKGTFKWFIFDSYINDNAASYDIIVFWSGYAD